MSEPDQKIAIGTRERMGRDDQGFTCAACKLPVWFRDQLPRTVPYKLCTECFLDFLEASKGEKMSMLVTPENIIAMLALLKKPTVQ